MDEFDKYMDRLLSDIRTLLIPCSGLPHVLMPRSGNCICHALKKLDVESFSIWRYDDELPSGFVRPLLSLRVESSTTVVLARHWRNEAYGVRFPDLLYMPDHVPDEVLQTIAEFCRIRHRDGSVGTHHIKRLTDALTRVAWVIAILHVAPFMDDEPTYYCFFMAQDGQEMDRFGSLMLQHDIRTFHLDEKSDTWPVPEECEIQAKRLWEQEMQLIEE